MANTIAPLIPVGIEALDVVSRELVGFLPSVTIDAAANRCAKGQTINIPVSPVVSTSVFTPSPTLTAGADQVVGSKTITIDQFKIVRFNWTGEEQYAANAAGGIGYKRYMQDQIEQGLRALVNEAEATVATALYKGASRAWGTAGTTPFQTDVSDPANIKKILDDNGAPQTGRSLIIDTTAGARLRSLTQLTKVNESGTTMTLRDGQLLDLHNISIKESAQVVNTTKGTGASYTTNTAGYAVGATAITLITGTGTIVAGDVITFAGDTNKYVVASDLSGGVVTLAAPGLRKAIPAAATAVTVGNSYTANVALSRNAFVFASRLPAVPDGGDLAIDRETITDSRSGISFEFAIYPGVGMNVLQIAWAWGSALVKAEHTAILLG